MVKPDDDSEELSLIDAVVFLKINRGKLLVFFFAFFCPALAFTLTRPTLYEAKMDLLIGSAAAFSTAPVEPLDQLKYVIESRFNDEIGFLKPKPVAVTSIRNTNILNLVALDTDRDEVKKRLDQIAQSFISEHASKIQQKKTEARKFITTSSNLHEQDIVQYLETISAANPTRVLSDMKIKPLPFSGLLVKGSVLGLFMSAFLALAMVFGLHICAKIAEAVREKT